MKKDEVSKTRLFSISRSIVTGGSFTAYHRSADQSNGTLTTVLGRIVHWFACTGKGSDHGRSSYSNRVADVRAFARAHACRTMLGCNGIAFRTVVPSINWRYSVRRAPFYRNFAFEFLRYTQSIYSRLRTLCFQLC